MAIGQEYNIPALILSLIPYSPIPQSLTALTLTRGGSRWGHRGRWGRSLRPPPRSWGWWSENWSPSGPGRSSSPVGKESCVYICELRKGEIENRQKNRVNDFFFLFFFARFSNEVCRCNMLPLVASVFCVLFLWSTCLMSRSVPSLYLILSLHLFFFPPSHSTWSSLSSLVLLPSTLLLHVVFTGSTSSIPIHPTKKRERMFSFV